MTPAAQALKFEELWIPASEFADAATPSYKLCLVLAGTAELSYRVDDHARRAALRPGTFAPVSPPSVEVPLGISAAQRHLMIELDEGAVQRAAGELGGDASDLGPLHERPFRDPFLSQLCVQALRAQRAGDTLGQAFVASIEDAFVLSLLRMAHGSAQPQARAPRPLAPSLVAKVRDHCLDRLGESIAVAEMAGIAGLGTHQFSRSFKRATGQSPQQYLIGLRVALAAELLAGTSLPLSEIALRCGFFDQAHLATTFSRQRGVAPSRYRRDARG